MPTSLFFFVRYQPSIKKISVIGMSDEEALPVATAAFAAEKD